MSLDPVQRWNERSLPNLQARLPEIFPAGVLAHALARRFIPRTPRHAVDSYWRAHPVRAERLARVLAARSGGPERWRWQPGAQFRLPPAPFREKTFALGPGHCCVCGQPIFRLGWHEDLWGTEAPNRRATWHTACVIAWQFWNAPARHRRALSAIQRRRCAQTGKRLLRTAHVDHRTPLYLVRREHGDLAWPDLLNFWGTPNLQVINLGAHAEKCALEAGERAAVRPSRRLQAGSSG